LFTLETRFYTEVWQHSFIGSQYYRKVAASKIKKMMTTKNQKISFKC